VLHVSSRLVKSTPCQCVKRDSRSGIASSAYLLSVTYFIPNNRPTESWRCHHETVSLLRVAFLCEHDGALTDIKQQTVDYLRR
jgi:hypothetical protein